MNTPRVEARKLKGFRDYLPAIAAKRQDIIDRMRLAGINAGFFPMDTPVLEYEDVLLGSAGGETEKEVYRFTDHGERAVALRFDLTMSFARYVTENFNDLPMPFKRCQVGEVWRGEKPQKGRYRQFAQADFDIVGVDSLESDVELISTLVEPTLAIVPTNSNLTLWLNHRSVLSALILNYFGATSVENEAKILIAVDKLKKIGVDPVTTLVAEITNNAAASKEFLNSLNLDLSHNSEWDKLSILVGEVGKTDVVRFRDTVILLLEIFSGSKLRICPALHVARGLGYYTGIVFETTIDQLTGFGSISSGGRYGNLVARFGKHDLSGVGGSVGVDRLLAALEELKIPMPLPAPKVFIAVASEDARSVAFSLRTELRRLGISTDLALKIGKLGQQFKFADKLGIPYVVTIGSEEVAQECFSLKNMKSGAEEKDLSKAALLNKLSVERGNWCQTP